jgi:membrane associated rhomboid family serine protease
MLSDRPYMRGDYQRERTSFLIWLLSAISAGFIIQAILERIGILGFERLTVLTASVTQTHYWWTFLTYPLIHAGILHVLIVGLSLFFIGRELATHVGERRMAGLALSATLVGGLAWFALNFNRPNALVGAAPIVLCYFTVFACLFANRQISFLVFFVLPVTTRPKYIAWALLAFEVLGLAFNEIPGRKLAEPMPHSAHLGAMLVGWLYFRFVHEGNWSFRRRSTELDLPRWLKATKKPALPPAPVLPKAAPDTREDLRAEVDRILDKINSHGFGALTPEEKRKLDSAKDMLSRR